MENSILELKHLCYRYPDSSVETLRGIDLSIQTGEFVVLIGLSGCGKTTLLRQMKPELTPHGVQSGTIMYCGKPLNELDKGISAREIGMVMQLPEQQMVLDDVRQELAFGLENIGLEANEIRRRVAEIALYMGLEGELDHTAETLSGGRKQWVALASVLAMRPKLLLLDEPTSQLDPIAAGELYRMLRKINRELGVTIVIAEHHLDEVVEIADRIVLLNNGEIVTEGSPEQVFKAMWSGTDQRYRAFVPEVPTIALQHAGEQIHPETTTLPLTVRDGCKWLQSHVDPKTVQMQLKLNKQDDTDRKKTMLSFDEVSFAYDRRERMILQRFNLKVYEGETLALIGGNGSGKSTVLRLAAGLLKPQRGVVKIEGQSVHRMASSELHRKIGYLPQNPMFYFSFQTLLEDLLYAANRASNGEHEARQMAFRFGLEGYLQQSPYDLSGGECQKAALACILLAKPNVLFIDEPTKGMDAVSKGNFARMLDELKQEEVTIVLVTHDLAFTARVSDRCAMLFDGQIASEGTPDQLFEGNAYYTTAKHRLLRAFRRQPAHNVEVDEWLPESLSH